MSILALCLACALAASSAPDTLTGHVVDENGAPLSGAVIHLNTAKPRTGLAVTCPSCYRDCARSAVTNGEGQFSVAELDPNLLFRVLIVAPGRKAVLTKWTDPVKTKLEVKLSPLAT